MAMSIYSPTHGMHFEWNLDEPLAAVADPNLPSTYAYGSEFFGELFGCEMSKAQIATGNAPHIDTHDRINRLLHLPEYYAYSPHTDTWEDGLREIEDFDWSADKEDEQRTGEGGDEVEGNVHIEAASSADVLRPADQDNDVNLADNDAVYLLGRTDSIAAPPEGQIQILDEPKDNAAISQIFETSALRPLAEQVGSGSLAGDNQPVEAQDAMGIDSASDVADTGHSRIGLEMEGCVGAEQETATISDTTAYQEESVVGNIMTETGPDTGLGASDAVDASIVTLAPTRSYQHDLFIHEPGLKPPPNNATASEVSSKDKTIDSECLVSPPLRESHDENRVSCKVSEASGQSQPRQDELEAQAHLQDDAAGQVQHVSDTFPSSSEKPSSVEAPSPHPEAKSADGPEVESEHASFDQPGASTLDEDVLTSPESPVALPRVEDNVNGQWQAQLRDAAAEMSSDLSDISSDGLDELLPPGYSDRNVHSVKSPPETTDHKALMYTHSPLTAPLPECQSYSSAVLPPLPFAHEHDATRNDEASVVKTEGDGKTTSERLSYEEAVLGKEEARLQEIESLGKEVQEAENTHTTQLAHRSLNPPAPNVESANTRAEDYVASPDLDDSKTTGEMPKNDLVEHKSPSLEQDTVEDLGSPIPSEPSSHLSSPSPMLAPKAQPVHTRKRSKPLEKTENASETETDAPPKKKSRKSAPAKSHASRAREPNKALEEQESDQAPSSTKTRRAVKPKKETTYTNGANRDIPAMIQDGSISSLKQAPVVDELDSMILGSDAEIQQHDHEHEDADMQEHYSDVEVLVTPSKHVPPIDNVPSTPRSRPKVSTREHEGLSPTKYRERPSKAKRNTLPISRQLFKPDTEDKSMSSMPAFEQSPAIPVGAIDKDPTARATKKQKVEPVEEEKYDLFPAPKMNLTKPTPLPDLPSPPRFSTNARRTTRNKKMVDKPEQVNFPVDESSVIEIPEPNDEDAILEDSVEEEIVNSSQVSDDDFEDAQETLNASDSHESSNDNVSDDMIPPPRKKAKLTNKSVLLRGAQNTSQSSSRASTAVPSSTATQATNKYGFSPARGPRTRQALKTAAASKSDPAPAFTPKAKAKAKVPAKRKAKTTPTAVAPDDTEEGNESEGNAQPTLLDTSTLGTATATATTNAKGKGKKSILDTDTPTTRQTRRASAMQGKLQHARDEEEKEAREKVRAETKAKLRRKG